MLPEIGPEFLTAGKARFLVTNPAGLQYTFRISQWVSRSTKKVWYFVDAQERSQWMEFVKMGTWDPETLEFSHGGNRAEVPADHPALKVFEWAVKRVVLQDGLPEGYEIKHCGKCGRCGRPLSVKMSVDRGIGPDCFGKVVSDSNRVRIQDAQQMSLLEV